MCLKEKFAFNCGPTLRGIKPSNLFSISSLEAVDCADELQKIYRMIKERGLDVVELCRCEKRKLIFVYNAKQISSLFNSDIKKYLHSIDYPRSLHIENYIDHLLWKLENSREFPHEIGFFLGFPQDDVFGYIGNKGRDCQCMGYWKVYGDAKKSQCLFEEHEKCRYDCLAKVQKGVHIKDIIKFV